MLEMFPGTKRGLSNVTIARPLGLTLLSLIFIFDYTRVLFLPFLFRLFEVSLYIISFEGGSGNTVILNE